MADYKPFQYKDAESFTRDLNALAPDLPYAEDLSPCAKEVVIGGRTLANRLAVHPMEGADGEADGSPGELTRRRYVRFAEGGAGLLWFEATAVAPEGRANPRQLHIHQGNVDAFRTLLDDSLVAAKAKGVPRPYTVLQLTHSGRQSFPGKEAAPIIAQVNPVLDRRPGRVITDDELEALRDRFVDAARFAADIGFDAVDLKACHGYLVGELLAARERPGRFGGSFENRVRWILDTAEAITTAVGDRLALASRFGVWDCIPGGWGIDEADYHRADFSEPIRLLSMLAERGLKIVDVTCGNPYFNPHVNRPFDRGFYRPPENQLEGAAKLLRAARAIREGVPQSVAVIATGFSWFRQFGANLAAGALRDGWCTMAGFGRQAFAYPGFAADIVAGKGLDPAKCCIACGNCTVIMRDGGRAGCMIRDAQVYGPIYKAGREGKPAIAMDTVAEHI